MNNKTLIYIFGGLLLIFIGSKLFKKQSDRSFEVEIVNIDTSLIDQIKLYPKAEQGAEIVFQKSEDVWTATKEGFSAEVTFTGIQGLLSNMANISVKRAVTKSSEKWPDYEVDEANGTRVVAIQGSKIMGDFVVGRFNFDQMSRSATSYIRKSDQNAVYAVDGFLGMSFNRDFNSFRDKELLKTSKEDITQISIRSTTLGDHQIVKQGNNWILDNTITLDSTKVATWINGMDFASGSEFDDSFNASSNPIHSMNILANNQTGQTTINAYQNLSGDKPYVIHSSENDKGFFPSDSAGVYSKFFQSVTALVSE